MRWIGIVLAGLALACNPSRPTAVVPEASPTPEPPATVTGCGLPAGGPFQHCARDLPFFNHELNEAIAEVQNEVPELFDFCDWQGGLSYREAHVVMEMVAESGKMTSFDLVEVNPTLDIRNTTAELGTELALSALGKSIL